MRGDRVIYIGQYAILLFVCSGFFFSVHAEPPAAPDTAPDLVAASDSGNSNTDNITNVTTPQFTGTCNNGETVRIYKDVGTEIGSVLCSGGTYTVDVVSIGADGGYSITSVFDNGEASGHSPALTITIDTAEAAPDTPNMEAAYDSGSSSSDNITNVSQPSFTVICNSDTTVTLLVDDANRDTGTCIAGSVTIALTTPLNEGNNSITAKQTDLAGNVSSQSVALTMVYDSSVNAPNAPDLTSSTDSGSSSSDDITNNTTPTFDVGNCETDATVQVYVNGVADNANTCPAQIIIGTVSDGTYTITAKQTDVAGNVSAFSSSLTVTVDTTLSQPGTPDLVANDDTGSSNTDDTTNLQSLHFTVSCESNAVVTLTLDSSSNTIETCSGGSATFSLYSLSAQSHLIHATQADAAGNSAPQGGTLSLFIDTTPPNAPDTPDLAGGSDTGSSGTDNLTYDTAPTFTGSCTSNEIVSIYDNGVFAGSGTCVSSTYNVTAGTLTEGTLPITAKFTDLAGNTGDASSALSITIDTTPPSAPGTPDMATGSDTGSSNTDNTTSETTPDFTGSCTTGETVTLLSGDTEIGSHSCPGGLFSITASTLSNGAQTIIARHTDTAGNWGDSSALSITIDTTPPSAPGTPDMATGSDTGSSNTDNTTSETTPTFDISCESGATVTLLSDSSSVGSGTCSSGTVSITASTLSTGSRSITATQTDVAGNISDASTALSITITTESESNSIAPPSSSSVSTNSNGGRRGRSTHYMDHLITRAAQTFTERRKKRAIPHELRSKATMPIRWKQSASPRRRRSSHSVQFPLNESQSSVTQGSE